MSALGSAVSYVQVQAMRGAVRIAPAWFEQRLLDAALEAAEAVTFTPGRVFVEQMMRFGHELLPRACPQCRRKVLDNFLASAIKGKRRAHGVPPADRPPAAVLPRHQPHDAVQPGVPGLLCGRYAKDDECLWTLLDRILRRGPRPWACTS